MDHLRQVRFVLAPLIFFASLLLVALENGRISLDAILELNAPQLVAIGGLFAALVVPLGFAIGGLSQLLLNAGFWAWRRDRVDASFDAQTWDHIWRAVEAESIERTHKNRLYATVLVELANQDANKGIIGWIDRRWNAFHASVNAIMALILSGLVACASGTVPGGYWWSISVALSILWLVQGTFNWRDVMGLIAFRAELASRKRSTNERRNTEDATG